MSARRLLAILFIFGSTAIAWFVLALSVETRTRSSQYELSVAVASLWGGQHAQRPPSADFEWVVVAEEEVTEIDSREREITRTVKRPVPRSQPLTVRSSRMNVDLALEHRRKGLLWYDTYTVDFDGRYSFRTPQVDADHDGFVEVRFPFPSSEAIYDDFSLRVNGEEISLDEQVGHEIQGWFPAAPGEEIEVAVRYRSRGLDTWSYQMVEDGVATVNDFVLAMTADFDDFDFPANTLSPTDKTRLDDGRWRLTWSFESLVSGKQIGIDLPNRLNPGPLTARITFFAPVCLLFFVTVLVMLGALGHLELHPMHYFFVSAAFFAFHLLMAYLVDHIDIHLAFAVSSAVSIGLVVTYLRLVCGLRKALLYAGGAQLVFLVLFSYAFFFQGLTGLTVTIGSILTLFMLMQLTGRVDWNRKFAPQTTS